MKYIYVHQNTDQYVCYHTIIYLLSSVSLLMIYCDEKDNSIYLFGFIKVLINTRRWR